MRTKCDRCDANADWRAGMSDKKPRELVQPIMTCLYSSEQLKEQMQLMEYVDELHSAYLELEAKLAECVAVLEIYEQRLAKEFKARNGVGHDLSRLAREVLAKVKK